MPTKIEHGFYIEDLEVGMFRESKHDVSEQDVEDFARISGDYNPLHMDEEYAKTTSFGGRIAHGAMTASYVSAILGNELPGPGAVFTTLELKFRAPVRIGDTVTARAEVAEVNVRRRRVILDMRCMVGDTIIAKGKAGVMVDARPTEDT